MLHVEFQGEAVRPFTQILGYCCKLCESLHFEALPNTLALRAVGKSRSTHLLIHLEPTAITKYSWTAPPAQGGGGRGAPAGADVSYTVSSKALLSSVLRQCNSLNKVSLSYKPASGQQEGNTTTSVLGGILGAADASAAFGGPNSTVTATHHTEELIVRTESSRGLVRRYALHLDDRDSEKGGIDPDKLFFEACCEPKMFTQFLTSFPANTPRLTLLPSSNRLTIRAAEDLLGGGGSDASGRGGTTASVDQRQFQRFGPTGYGNANTVLYGKTVEAKPLKYFCSAAEQMGLKLRILFGGQGTPIMLEAVSYFSASTAGNAAPGGGAAHNNNNNNNTSGGLIAGIFTPVSLCNMMVAALDTELEDPASVVLGGRGSGGARGTQMSGIQQSTQGGGGALGRHSVIQPTAQGGGLLASGLDDPSFIASSSGGGGLLPQRQQQPDLPAGDSMISMPPSSMGGGAGGRSTTGGSGGIPASHPTGGVGATPTSRMKRTRSVEEGGGDVGMEAPSSMLGGGLPPSSFGGGLGMGGEDSRMSFVPASSSGGGQVVGSGGGSSSSINNSFVAGSIAGGKVDQHPTTGIEQQQQQQVAAQQQVGGGAGGGSGHVGAPSSLFHVDFDALLADDDEDEDDGMAGYLGFVSGGGGGDAVPPPAGYQFNGGGGMVGQMYPPQVVDRTQQYQ